MKRHWKYWLLLALPIMAVVGHTQGAYTVRGDEVHAYKFDEFVSLSGDPVYLYKSVHEGCELFIVTGHMHAISPGFNTSEGPTLALVAGRGCK